MVLRRERGALPAGRVEGGARVACPHLVQVLTCCPVQRRQALVVVRVDVGAVVQQQLRGVLAWGGKACEVRVG